MNCFVKVGVRDQRSSVLYRERVMKQLVESIRFVGSYLWFSVMITLFMLFIMLSLLFLPIF